MSRTSAQQNIKRFGEKLKGLRNAHRLTLQKFAQSLGYSAHGYISELETGKKLPTIEFALCVSRVYGVSLDQLLKDELDIVLPILKDEAR